MITDWFINAFRQVILYMAIFPMPYNHVEIMNTAVQSMQNSFSAVAFFLPLLEISIFISWIIGIEMAILYYNIFMSVGKKTRIIG